MPKRADVASKRSPFSPANAGDPSREHLDAVLSQFSGAEPVTNLGRLDCRSGVRRVGSVAHLPLLLILNGTFRLSPGELPRKFGGQS
jgi:hypothetical protein